MTTEIFIQECEDKIEKVRHERLCEAIQMVEAIKRGEIDCDYEDVKFAVSEANDWISFTCKEDDELYEKYAYKLFQNNDGFEIARGIEDFSVQRRYE